MLFFLAGGGGGGRLGLHNQVIVSRKMKMIITIVTGFKIVIIEKLIAIHYFYCCC